MAVWLLRLFVGIVLTQSSPAISQRLPLDGATAEVCFTPGADCAGLVAKAIGQAKSRVWLLGYGFSEGTILTALVDARNRGVDVRVVLDKSNDGRYSGATFAAKFGIPVRIDRSVRIAHNKLIIIDHDTVVVGSLNWTKSGNTKNAENVHIVRGSNALVRVHAAYFQSREEISEPYSLPKSGPQSR